MITPVIDTGFFAFITHKYARIRPQHPKFPSLVFLHNYTPANILLHYLLLKNMNILRGNRDYRFNQHQHQHLHFVVNLFLRISPPFPVPAAPAATHLSLLAQSMTDRFYQAVFPARSVLNHFYNAVFPQLYTRFYRPRLPGPGTAGAYPGISPQHAAAEFYPAALVFPRISHTDHVYNYRELLIKMRKVVKSYYISRERHTQTLMLKKTGGIIKPVGDVLFSQSFVSPQPGTSASYPTRPVFTGTSHMSHVHGIPRESKPAAGEELEPDSGSSISKTGNDYRIFSRDSQTLNMFEKVVKSYYISRERHTQTLMLKKTDGIIKPVGDVLFSQSFVSPQPGTSASYPTRPAFTGAGHMSHVHGIPRESKPAAGEKLEPDSGSSISKTGNDNRIFSRDSKTLNMFVKENRELLNISRERHTQILKVKKTGSLIKPVGDLLFTQSLESSQPGTVTHDNGFSPGDDEHSHREYPYSPRSPYSPILMATASYPPRPEFKWNIRSSQMSHIHGFAGEAQPTAAAELETVPGPWKSKTGNDNSNSKFPGVSSTLKPLMLIETNPVFTRETRLTSEMSHPAVIQQSLPSLTSPVISNITRKYTSTPGDIHGFFPTAPDPDLYYSAPMKGVGSNLEESRTVTGSIKGIKSLEEAAPAPAKIFGPEHAGGSKKPEVDLDRLTDQVFRKLERKITIEKERRGW